MILWAGLAGVCVGLLLVLSSGCATTGTGWDKEQTCETATAAYAVYQAVLAADAKPSSDQIAAAKAAAAYLVVYCGQTPATTSASATRAKPAARLIDAYGVLVIKDWPASVPAKKPK